MYAYCLNSPVSMADDGGDVPWRILFGDWGKIHRFVQDEIWETYGYITERSPVAGSFIRIDVRDRQRIWEIKSCGPAALGANAQLDRYLDILGPGYSKGTGIAPAYFTRTDNRGTTYHIVYWESEPGVILYLWDVGASDLQRATEALGLAAYGFSKLINSADISPSLGRALAGAAGGAGLFSRASGGGGGPWGFNRTVFENY